MTKAEFVSFMNKVLKRQDLDIEPLNPKNQFKDLEKVNGILKIC